MILLALAISFSWAQEHLAFSPGSHRKATLERQVFSVAWVRSATGVAVMGQAPGVYTFMAHLVGLAIALGYATSVFAHLLIYARYFMTGV